MSGKELSVQSKDKMKLTDTRKVNYAITAPDGKLLHDFRVGNKRYDGRDVCLPLTFDRLHKKSYSDAFLADLLIVPPVVIMLLIGIGFSFVTAVTGQGLLPASIFMAIGLAPFLYTVFGNDIASLLTSRKAPKIEVGVNPFVVVYEQDNRGDVLEIMGNKTDLPDYVNADMELLDGDATDNEKSVAYHSIEQYLFFEETQLHEKSPVHRAFVKCNSKFITDILEESYGYDDDDVDDARNSVLHALGVYRDMGNDGAATNYFLRGEIADEGVKLRDMMRSADELAAVQDKTSAELDAENDQVSLQVAKQMFK